MDVNAMAAFETGAELEPFKFQLDEVQADECIVKIQKCGVCFSDVHLIQDDWGMSKYPLVPGHEIIGTVLQVGTSVTHLKKGDRVGIGWQRSSCLACKDCLKGEENLCQVDFQLTSGNHFGGFASHIQIDSRFAFLIPTKLKSEEAASLLCAGAAVYAGLKAAGLTSGGNIGVIGLGGLGHLAVQFASKLGNKVTVFEYAAHKTDLAYEMGATEVILTSEKLPRKLENPLSLILNTVNKSLDWRSYMRLIDSKGTLMLLASGPKVEIPFSSLVYQQKRIMGSMIAGRRDILETISLADKYGIRTYVEEFELRNVNEAILRLKNNELKYRAVLAM